MLFQRGDEEQEAFARADKLKQKAKLLGILAEKEDEELKGLSKKAIKKLIDNL